MPGLSGTGAGGLGADAEALLAHLRGRGRSANTLAAYRRDLAAYERFLAGRGVDAAGAGEADVEEYVAGLAAAGRRPASVARALVSLRALHRWCGSDAAGRVGPPHPPPAAPPVLGEAEVAALLDSVAPTTPTARRDRALLEVLYATGARISEVVGLSVGDVGGGLARLGGTRARVVPYGRHAAAALEAWLSAGGRDALAPGPASPSDGGDGGALLVNRRGGRLSRQWAWSVVRHHGECAGLAGRLSPHVLRHSFAAHLAARGAPPAALQQLLGGQPGPLDPAELAQRYRRWHPRA